MLCGELHPRPRAGRRRAGGAAGLDHLRLRVRHLGRGQEARRRPSLSQPLRDDERLPARRAPARLRSGARALAARRRARRRHVHRAGRPRLPRHHVLPLRGPAGAHDGGAGSRCTATLPRQPVVRVCCPDANVGSMHVRGTNSRTSSSASIRCQLPARRPTSTTPSRARRAPPCRT